MIEIVSPSDRYSALTQKLLAWLDAGARLVWVVDPETELVIVYRSDHTVRLLHGEDAELSGEDALPGFTARLGDIFG